jgi:hypothetical protein
MADIGSEKTANDEYSALGADLEAAWDDSDTTDEASNEIPEDDGVVAEEQGDPTKSEAASETGEEVEEEAGEGGEETAEAGDETGAEEVQKAEVSTAPVGLPPEAREAWNDTPPAMQKAIAQREREFNVGIQRYAEGAKRAEGMDKALEPYQQYLSMNGGNSHIGTLLQTGAGLQMGSPIQKAQTVANLIKQYGVDIGTLDGMLVGEGAPPAAQQQNDVQEAVTAAMAPYQQFMGSMQKQQENEQQQAQQNVTSSVEAFASNPANEFYNDVKMDMADLMDMAANQGRDLSMEDAYKKACHINEGISTIIASRRSATEIAGKRKAAASITGGPGGPGGLSQSTNIRGAIEDAWDNVGRV